ncbi:oligopeptide/dipeptide ABC transporter ATP-binding protein [Mangrovicoccus ximenensis]|uniref:oligopeptide/dipeptide ABC transporter ATP-binding protein n=1 Tax=Mangrovicoccus ximenensis TaxID=1911570 RepID=UPI000D3D2EE9|nr:oligopeptide/dipeptide ABC transporter ATP-binding protein [Mangrovicoccus ximenensis]
MRRGETVALVGESGCGKSTLGKCVVGLESVSGGAIRFGGTRIDTLRRGARQGYARRIQMIFQDPLTSLNPRMKIGAILAEPLRNYRPELGPQEIRNEVARLLRLVRMPVDSAERWPHEFSGGQAQRIAIARALAPQPELIVCDEATSALDVSIKAQIVNLLQDLQAELGLALLFISHDLGIVRSIAQRVAVMYRGTLVELGPGDAVFGAPQHPYTRALLSAVLPPKPGAAPARQKLEGELPSATARLSGCPFRSRCPEAQPGCASESPARSQASGAASSVSISWV